jgi:uncharacterized protein YdeI (YjbR/CyaY-like superfamily)
MNPNVDLYLLEGCGRCSLYRTPECKVHTWSAELEQLRRIVLDCGLEEELKWSQPCYTFQKDNVLMVTAFKEYAAIAFFKGSLLKDTQRILIAPGTSSQASRQIRFTDVQKIIDMEETLKAFIYEAIEVKKEGLKVNFKKNPEPLPEELLQKFEGEPDFKSAFEALTPGRQRGYIIHFSQPKQSKTRISRIEKYMDKILKGEGFFD